MFEENYGVTVLARSVEAEERDSILQYVDPAILIFRPVVQLIEKQFQDWMQDIQRMHAHRQPVPQSQKATVEPVTVRKSRISGGCKPQCVSMFLYV
jgi:hypothetical protein